MGEDVARKAVGKQAQAVEIVVRMALFVDGLDMEHDIFATRNQGTIHNGYLSHDTIVVALSQAHTAGTIYQMTFGSPLCGLCHIVDRQPLTDGARRDRLVKGDESHSTSAICLLPLLA